MLWSEAPWTSLPASRVSINPASWAAGRSLNATQSLPDELHKARFLPPTRSCHVNPTNNAARVDPAFSGIIWGITWPDQYIGELWCKCYHVQILHTKPPTSQEGQRQLCLNLYLPCSTCPKMLCCFVCTSSKGLPFSLHLSLCRFLHLSLALPLSHWWFVFLLWDLGSHSLRAHCSALIHSRGWAPRGRMGDCGCSRLSLLPLPLPLLLATPLLAPCHTMMSWLLFAPGVPIDSLSVLHTLYLPPLPPYPP